MAGTYSINNAGARSDASILQRLNRLPRLGYHWRLVLISQLFWGAMATMDVLVLRIYPVVWGPNQAFSELQYTLLLGVASGLGPLIGVFLFGHLSDTWGRKKTMIVCALIAGIFSFPLGLTASWAILMPLAVIYGTAVGGALVTSPTYNIEITPTESRGRLMFGGQIVGFLLVVLIVNLVARFLLPTHLFAFTTTFAVLALVMVPLILFGIPESPRWLASHGREEEASRIVARMEEKAKARGHRLDSPEPEQAPATQPKAQSLRSLLKGANLRKVVFLLFVWGLIYTGVNYGFQAFQSVYIIEKGYSPADLFTMLLVASPFAILAVIVGAFLNERMERKTYVLLASFIVVLSAVVQFYLYASYFWMTVGTILTFFGLSAILSSMYNYTSAVFPTEVRSSGIALTDGVSHLAVLFASPLAGVFYTWTTASNHSAWFIWFALVGALLPAALLYFFGTKQSNISLEEIAG